MQLVKRVLGKKRQKNVVGIRSTSKYHSVEICPNGNTVPHLFKIRHTNKSSMAILIREDSSLLRYLNEGDRLEMIYYPSPSTYPNVTLQTKIKQISRDERGRYRGHFLVDLAVM